MVAQEHRRGTAPPPAQQRSRLRAFAKKTWKKLAEPKKKAAAAAAAATTTKGGNVYSTTAAATASASAPLLTVHLRPTHREHHAVSEASRSSSALRPEPTRDDFPPLYPVRRLSLELTDGEARHLPPASSVYDESVGLRSPINHSSPLQPGALDAPSSYTPVRPSDTPLIGAPTPDRASTKTHTDHARYGLPPRPGHGDSLLPDVPGSDATSALPAASLSRLHEAMRWGRKSVRSSQLAAHVLGVPELLEAVLLLAAYDSRPPPHVGPAHWLYTAQQVNRSFHDTIGGSRALRQLMWLAREDGGGAGGKDWCLARQPLGWLLRSLGVWDDISCNTRREGRRATGFAADYTLRFPIRDQRARALLARANRGPLAGASCARPSWRAMPACRWRDPPTLRFEFQYVATDALLPLRRHDRVHWALHDHTSLGDVLDVLRQVLQIHDDFRARRDEVERLRAVEDSLRVDGLQTALRTICAGVEPQAARGGARSR